MKEVWALMSEYPQEGGGEVARCYTDELRAKQDMTMVQATSHKSWKLFKVLLVEGSGIVTEWGGVYGD